MKIFPAIDIKDKKCVRLVQGNFDNKTEYETSPIEQAGKYKYYGFKNLHIVDLDGAKEGFPVNMATIAEVCKSTACPCELGGGIRSVDHIREALTAGVNRVILGTWVADNPAEAKNLVREFSAERLVAGIDARNGMVATRGWLEDSSRTAIDLSQELFNYGLRTIIYTDIHKDGTFAGPNMDELRKLCEALPEANIVASGGVGTVQHVKDLAVLANDLPNLDGVIVGKALYDGRLTIESLIEAGQ